MADDVETLEKGLSERDLKALARVTVNLVRPAQTSLMQLMELTGLSKTDLVNRALQIYGDLQRTMSAGGAVYVQEQPKADLERIRLY